MKILCTMQALLLACLLSLIATNGYAHGGGHGGGGNKSGAINTPSAQTLEAGRWGVSVEETFTKQKRFSDAELISRAAKHIHVHGMDYMSVTNVNASYGVSDNFEVGLSLPYIRNDTIRAGHHSHGPGGNTVEDHGDSYGLGDVTLMSKYKLPVNWYGVEVAFMAGLQLPTGKTDVSYAGERLSTEHQPGSGSTDPILGVAFSKNFGAYNVDASLSQMFNTGGAQDTELGDVTSFNLGVSYRVGGEEHKHKDGGIHKHAAVDYVLELNGERAAQQKVSGIQDTSTGGTQIFLSPGVRYTSPQGWAAQASLGLPVVRNMNAGEAETDYRISSAIGFSF